MPLEPSFRLESAQTDKTSSSIRQRIEHMALQSIRCSGPSQVQSQQSIWPSTAHSARPSQVRQVLSQAAAHMNLPEHSSQPRGASEYERLRSTLQQMKAEAQGTQTGLTAVNQQIAFETESSRLAEHMNSHVRTMQRSFGVLADTLEDEVTKLRDANSHQWEQLKVCTVQQRACMRCTCSHSNAFSDHVPGFRLWFADGLIPGTRGATGWP